MTQEPKLREKVSLMLERRTWKEVKGGKYCRDCKKAYYECYCKSRPLEEDIYDLLLSDRAETIRVLREAVSKADCNSTSCCEEECVGPFLKAFDREVEGLTKNL